MEKEYRDKCGQAVLLGADAGVPTNVLTHWFVKCLAKSNIWMGLNWMDCAGIVKMEISSWIWIYHHSVNNACNALRIQHVLVYQPPPPSSSWPFVVDDAFLLIRQRFFGIRLYKVFAQRELIMCRTARKYSMGKYSFLCIIIYQNRSVTMV